MSNFLSYLFHPWRFEGRHPEATHPHNPPQLSKALSRSKKGIFSSQAFSPSSNKSVITQTVHWEVAKKYLVVESSLHSRGRKQTEGGRSLCSAFVKPSCT